MSGAVKYCFLCGFWSRTEKWSDAEVGGWRSARVLVRVCERCRGRLEAKGAASVLIDGKRHSVRLKRGARKRCRASGSVSSAARGGRGT